MSRLYVIALVLILFQLSSIQGQRIAAPAPDLPEDDGDYCDCQNNPYVITYNGEDEVEATIVNKYDENDPANVYCHKFTIKHNEDRGRCGGVYDEPPDHVVISVNVMDEQCNQQIITCDVYEQVFHDTGSHCDDYGCTIITGLDLSTAGQGIIISFTNDVFPKVATVCMNGIKHAETGLVYYEPKHWKYPYVCPGIILPRICHRGTEWPTKSPTEWPTKSLTTTTTESPTEWPTKSPTEWPTKSPAEWPTKSPTEWPTKSPTEWPTKFPTEWPTKSPTWPTKSPTWPTKSPTWPTKSPTEWPTKSPTEWPTRSPTSDPTSNPTEWPTKSPTEWPTKSPAEWPTKSPTEWPTKSPTKSPTRSAY